jgi:hypothetical protein
MGPARSFASRTLVVDGSPVADVELRLRSGVATRGRIVFDGDAAPPPPNRVRVMVRSIDFVSGPVGGGPPPSRTNDDWTFEISGLTAIGMLRVDPPPPWKLARVTLNGDDVTDKVLTFQDRDVENLEITLTSRFGAIAGRIFDAQGQPTAQGVVIAFAEDESKLTFPSRFISLARPDGQGRYTFAGLPPSTYLLVAVPGIQGTEWEDPSFLKTLRGNAAKVVMLDGSNVTQDLKLPKM